LREDGAGAWMKKARFFHPGTSTIFSQTPELASVHSGLGSHFWVFVSVVLNKMKEKLLLDVCISTSAATTCII
jgi:hypothetical protein